MNNYNYEILNYWNDQDDLYIDYIVTNNKDNSQVHTVGYSNTSDIGCDYSSASSDEIKECLLLLLKQNDGLEFSLPKVSELSPLLTYVYDFVCESESNMCHIDYNDWEELKDEDDFREEDINALKNEIKKYYLDDYIKVDDGEYKICGFGGLQCCFNDNRERNDGHER